MAVMNTRFYRKSDDALYSDGDIENVIYERVCKGDTTLANDPEWTVFYHFSPIRQNILNWYPFNDGCSILEIGAGCGALTGMLAQRATHVTACELTMKRARILYQRHKDFDNLEVCVGNFLEAEFDRKYDYIVINGVLEYARGIMGNQHKDPYTAFLKHARSYLKPEGTILLSIENRFGLKYLAGAPEDHVGKTFAGVNGYKNGEHVQTFSKSELEELVSWAGLSVHRWYYPYPDYKFPTEIFTDDSVNSKKPVTQDIPFDMRRADLFDKEAVYETLMKDQIAGNFSNSFLVELSAVEQVRKEEPTYIKISNNRKKDFAVCTVLYERSKYVEKIALYPEGVKHLANMAIPASTNSQLQSIPYDTVCPQKLRYHLVEEESLRNILQRQLQSGETGSFWETIRGLYSCLYTDGPAEQKEDPRFASVFGPKQIVRRLHWANNINIDLNVDNVFQQGNQWKVIDNEWVFPFMIPAEYAMWRILSQLQWEKPFRDILSEEAIGCFLNISKTEISVFREWEAFFTEQYVGIQDLSIHYQPIIPVDIDDIMTQHQRSNCLISHLFLFREGMEPEVLECAAVNNNGIWSVSFQSENMKKADWIRWDPLEGCACRITDIHADGFSIKAINADPEEAEYTFATFDPQFSVTGDFSRCTCLNIQFQCEIRDWTTGYFKLEGLYNREKELRLQETALKEQTLFALNNSIRQIQTNAELYQQDILEKNQLIERFQQSISEKKQEIEQLQQETAEKQADISRFRRETAYMQETIADLNAAADQLCGELQQLKAALDEQSERNRTLVQWLSNHRLKAIVKILFGKEF